MTAELRKDEHGRTLYPDSVVPPVDAGLSMWKGNVTADYPPDAGNSVSGCHPSDGRRPYAVCDQGWVRSGRWYLHCTVCHPAPRPTEELTPRRWVDFTFTDHPRWEQVPVLPSVQGVTP